MKLARTICLTCILSSAAVLSSAEVSPSTQPTAADVEAAYTKSINDRAAKIVAALDIADEAKAARVTQTIADQYRALRDIHDQKDGIDEKLKARHDVYLASLAADLDASQVEKVKDGMTYNVVNITYKGYQDMLPTLTEPQKEYILDTLKEARELAMDQGTSDAKHKVFGKYKGRITNFLAKEGYDLKAASKEWAERRKAAANNSKK